MVRQNLVPSKLLRHMMAVVVHLVIIICLSSSSTSHPLLLRKTPVGSNYNSSANAVVYIVYVYIATPSNCYHGPPRYMLDTLIHSVNNNVIQHSSNNQEKIVLIGNFQECNTTKSGLEKVFRSSSLLDPLNTFEFVDIESITSDRTRLFIRKASCSNSSRTTGGRSGLLHSNPAMATVTRFFYIEDFISSLVTKSPSKTATCISVIHSELDNLLFGSYSQLSATLKSTYPHQLATLPLTSTYMESNITPIRLITSAVMWIPNQDSIRHLNNFFIELQDGFASTEQNHKYDNPNNLWQKYLNWIEQSPSNIVTSSSPANSNLELHLDGIRSTTAVSELTLLAFYHHLPGDRLKLLLNQIGGYEGNVTNASDGSIWDAGHWGQVVGGVHKQMRKKISSVVHKDNCRIGKDCSNHLSGAFCAGSPTIHCPNQPIQRLWNLHLLSKNITGALKHLKCPCL